MIPYRQLASMAKPAYDDDGELFDGGFDMSTGGVCGYDFLLLFYFCWMLAMPSPCLYFIMTFHVVASL